MDYSRNRKFFKAKPSPKFVLTLIVIGVIGFLIKPIIGIAFIALAVVVAVLQYGGRPTAAEIDAQAKSALNDLKARALKKLGIEEEEVTLAKPIEFWGYQLGPTVLGGDLNGIRDVQGKDGVSRSPEVKVSGFYFSEHSVHFYYRIFSLISDLSREGTEEYFYKDVVSVKTESQDEQLYDRSTGKAIPGLHAHSETFILRNTGGEATVCSVYDTGIADEACKAMRNLLKQKKLEG